MSQPPDPFEFLKSLWGPMGLPLPPLPGLGLDRGEVDKRIAELKSVENWLNMNLEVLRATVQGLEMHRAALAAVQQAAAAPAAPAASVSDPAAPASAAAGQGRSAHQQASPRNGPGKPARREPRNRRAANRSLSSRRKNA